MKALSLAVLIAAGPLFAQDKPTEPLVAPPQQQPTSAPPESTQQPQGATPPQTTPPPQATPPADDFELLAPEKKPDAAAQAREAELQRELARRRTMLQLHQIAGFATIASVGATVVLGQLNYNDKYGGGGDTGKYITAHAAVAYAATGIFAATGLLAVLAPSPFDKPLRWDTATIHKASMAIATAGMAAQIILGIVTAGKEGQISQRDFALAHQIIGYTTAGAVLTGFTVLAF